MPIWRGTCFPRQYPRGPAKRARPMLTHWVPSRTDGPVLAENSPLDCFPGARTPFDRFHLRLKALAVKSAMMRFIALVDRLPAAKIAPPATCLNLRFNQVGLRSRLRNLWFRTSRRACRRQRLKHGALPPPNPRQVGQGTIFDHLRFRNTMVAAPLQHAACRHKSSKNGCSTAWVGERHFS